MKTCTKCGIEKPLDNYYDKGGRTGQKVSRCKSCTTEDRIEYNKQYYLKKRDYYENRRNLRMYGITVEQRDIMFAEQGNACAICKTTDGKWAVDHDHATGEVRGILCHNCNRALGMVKDNKETLQAAIDYLSK